MLNSKNPQDRIVRAALSLAAENDWHDVDLAQIATAAEVDLADVRALFETRSDILKAFIGAVDRAVLKKMAKDGESTDAARDMLFDTLMTRFEILEPYKAALKRLSRSPSTAIELLPTSISAQRWMLSAAGISSAGAKGNARALGLTAVYARVFQIWLEDEDPGLAKTMAALDSRLRNGERIIRQVDDGCSILKGVAQIIFGSRRRSDTDTGSPSGSTPAGAD